MGCQHERKFLILIFLLFLFICRTQGYKHLNKKRQIISPSPVQISSWKGPFFNEDEQKAAFQQLLQGIDVDATADKRGSTRPADSSSSFNIDPNKLFNPEIHKPAKHIDKHATPEAETYLGVLPKGAEEDDDVSPQEKLAHLISKPIIEDDVPPGNDGRENAHGRDFDNIQHDNNEHFNGDEDREFHKSGNGNGDSDDVPRFHDYEGRHFHNDERRFHDQKHRFHNHEPRFALDRVHGNKHYRHNDGQRFHGNDEEERQFRDFDYHRGTNDGQNHRHLQQFHSHHDDDGHFISNNRDKNNEDDEDDSERNGKREGLASLIQKPIINYVKHENNDNFHSKSGIDEDLIYRLSHSVKKSSIPYKVAAKPRKDLGNINFRKSYMKNFVPKTRKMLIPPNISLSSKNQKSKISNATTQNTTVNSYHKKLKPRNQTEISLEKKNATIPSNSSFRKSDFPTINDDEIDPEISKNTLIGTSYDGSQPDTPRASIMDNVENHVDHMSPRLHELTNGDRGQPFGTQFSEPYHSGHNIGSQGYSKDEYFGPDITDEQDNIRSKATADKEAIQRSVENSMDHETTGLIKEITDSPLIDDEIGHHRSEHNASPDLVNYYSATPDSSKAQLRHVLLPEETLDSIQDWHGDNHGNHDDELLSGNQEGAPEISNHHPDVEQEHAIQSIQDDVNIDDEMDHIGMGVPENTNQPTHRMRDEGDIPMDLMELGHGHSVPYISDHHPDISDHHHDTSGYHLDDIDHHIDDTLHHYDKLIENARGDSMLHGHEDHFESVPLHSGHNFDDIDDNPHGSPTADDDDTSQSPSYDDSMLHGNEDHFESVPLHSSHNFDFHDHENDHHSENKESPDIDHPPVYPLPHSAGMDLFKDYHDALKDGFEEHSKSGHDEGGDGHGEFGHGLPLLPVPENHEMSPDEYGKHLDEVMSHFMPFHHPMWAPGQGNHAMPDHGESSHGDHYENHGMYDHGGSHFRKPDESHKEDHDYPSTHHGGFDGGDHEEGKHGFNENSFPPPLESHDNKHVEEAPYEYLPHEHGGHSEDEYNQDTFENSPHGDEPHGEGTHHEDEPHEQEHHHEDDVHDKHLLPEVGPRLSNSPTGDMTGPTLGGAPANAPAGGAPANAPTGGAPANAPTGGAPANAPTGGAPANVPTGGAPANVPTGGAPANAPTGGAPVNVPTGGAPANAPTGGAPANVPTGGAPANAPTGGAPANAPTGGAPANAPTGGLPVNAPAGGNAKNNQAGGVPVNNQAKAPAIPLKKIDGHQPLRRPVPPELNHPQLPPIDVHHMPVHHLRHATQKPTGHIMQPVIPPDKAMIKPLQNQQQPQTKPLPGASPYASIDRLVSPASTGIPEPLDGATRNLPITPEAAGNQGGPVIQAGKQQAVIKGVARMSPEDCCAKNNATCCTRDSLMDEGDQVPSLQNVKDEPASFRNVLNSSKGRITSGQFKEIIDSFRKQDLTVPTDLEIAELKAEIRELKSNQIVGDGKSNTPQGSQIEKGTGKDKTRAGKGDQKVKQAKAPNGTAEVTKLIQEMGNRAVAADWSYGPRYQRLQQLNLEQQSLLKNMLEDAVTVLNQKPKALKAPDPEQHTVETILNTGHENDPGVQEAQLMSILRKMQKSAAEATANYWDSLKNRQHPKANANVNYFIKTKDAKNINSETKSLGIKHKNFSVVVEKMIGAISDKKKHPDVNSGDPEENMEADTEGAVELSKDDDTGLINELKESGNKRVSDKKNAKFHHKSTKYKSTTEEAYADLGFTPPAQRSITGRIVNENNKKGY